MNWLEGNRKLLLMVVLSVVGGIALISGVITLEDFKELLGRTQIEEN